MALKADEFQYGLIAGGMSDGTIYVWDPAQLLAGESEALIAKVEQHEGPVNGLQFNPHREATHLLASGGR
jgi:protein transport protein SEC31